MAALIDRDVTGSRPQANPLRRAPATALDPRAALPPRSDRRAAGRRRRARSDDAARPRAHRARRSRRRADGARLARPRSLVFARFLIPNREERLEVVLREHLE